MTSMGRMGRGGPLLAAWAAACGDAPTARQPAHEPLPEVAAERGLVHIDRSGGPEKRFVLEANGAGLALLDLGADGDLDVVVGQGLGSFEALGTGPGADLAVFENDGRGRFRARAGPGLAGWWTGLAAGDLDGDGATDLVAAGFGRLLVLLQGPDGELRPVAELVPAERRLVPGASAPEGAPDWATSLALADLDGDGVLDLYVGRYLALDPAAPPLGALGTGPLAVPCVWRGMPVYCGPRGLEPQPDAVFRGRGDGTFEDVSQAWLPGHRAGYTLGVLAADLDGDGDIDVAVANDSAPNLLLINDGSGVLSDFGYAAGFALGPDGQKEAGMGLAAGDVDGDGRLDLAVTNFSEEPTRLLLAAERGFRDVTHRVGLGRMSRPLLSWGVHLADLDGDGGLELFTANGHVYPQADAPHTGTSYGQADTLWRVRADGALEPVPPASERSLLAARTGSRGSALGDVDGDGRPDLLVSRIDGPLALGLNRFEGANWLEVRLEGVASPRDGNGAVVEVRAAGRTQRRAAGTSGSYQSSSTPFVHLGLGAAAEYEALSVRWPSGRIEALGRGPTGQRLVVREGAGVVRSEPLVAPALTLGATPVVSAGQSNAAPIRSDAAPRFGPPREPLLPRARAELLDSWSMALAVRDVADLAREGPAFVAAGGALHGDTEALGLIARALHAAGEPERARALLATAPERDAELRLAEAAMALDEDDLAGALDLLGVTAPAEPLSLLDPERADAWLIAGRALARGANGSSARARAALERAIALAPLHPDAPTALHLLARDAVARGDDARAAALRTEADRRARWHEVFRARSLAKRLHPTAPEPRLALAELWRAVGALDRARAELDTLLELHPGHPEARTRRAALE